MFARVNEGEAINVHNVGFIKVMQINAAGIKPDWTADFYNGGGKPIARSYAFESEGDCWDFVRKVVSDGSRRDLLEFKHLDGKVVAA